MHCGHEQVLSRAERPRKTQMYYFILGLSRCVGLNLHNLHRHQLKA